VDQVQTIDDRDDGATMPEHRPVCQAPKAAPTAPRKPHRKARQIFLKQLHTWHWISAAISLVGMFLFAITGITLNHASSIDAKPKVVDRSAMLPPPLLALLKAKPATSDAPLPDAVAAKIADLISLDGHGKPAEWSDDEVYVAMPGPGTDAWISVERATGKISSEYTDRGWISYFNDLHKGRNTGSRWFWFIDAFAVACIVFTMTGFLLLQLHAKHRPSTWPLVALGTAIPLIIAIFLIH
jgi:hypothetical protein